MASKIKTFVFFALMIFSNLIFAHQVAYHNHIYRDGHLVNEEVEIEDPKRNDSGQGTNYVVEREVLVHLIYGREGKTDIAGNFWTYKVSFDLFEDGANSPFQSDELLISSDPNDLGVYEAARKYTTSVGKVRLVITGVEATDGTGGAVQTNPATIGTLVPDDIRLELRMDVERYDFLNPNNDTEKLGASYDEANHNLLFYWEHIQGAESYELEWAFIDDETVNKPSIQNEYDRIFEDAVRIEICENSYEMPLTLPAGEIFYRVRPVGRYIQNVGTDYSHLKYGAWRNPSGGELQSIISNGFEANRNWQYTTSFAEDGKYKKVINYFDEGLKSRQTLTNLSTEDVTLVATNHYDVEGRQTLSMLPVPAVGDNSLFYKPRFNRNNNNDGYSRINFDSQASINGSASKVSELKADITVNGQTKNLGGAGYYFSSQHNSDALGTGMHKAYIPHAGGMPFTQVKYMNDGTGRPISQSGVGEFYKIGSDRETKYFYDDASSSQLRRLFGKNVGEAKYYRRNLVKDANGQLSISYIDQSGNVVATALGGSSASNVQNLSSAAAGTVTMTENLIENNIVNHEQGTSVTATSIMNDNPIAQTASFSYNFSGEDQYFTTGGYCVSCDYKLTITVTDPDGMLVEISNEGFELTRDFNGANDCTSNTTYTPSDVPVNFDVIMNKVGTYRVIKTVKVVKKSIDALEAIVETNNLINTIETFAAEYPVDYLNCAITCEQVCDAKIRMLNPTLSEAQLIPLIQTCITNDCANNNEFLAGAALAECVGILATLEEQIAPGGCQEQAATIEAHPEYCQLVYCEETVTERTFDYELANATSWMKFLENNGHNPNLGLTWSNVNSLVINKDPMFLANIGFYSAYASNPNVPGNVNTSGTMKAEIANAISTFGGFGLIKEEVVVGLFAIGDNSSINVIDFLKTVTQQGSSTLMFPTLENQWNAFVGFYLGEKRKLSQQIKDDWCPTSVGDCAVVFEGGDFLDMFSGVNDATQANQQADIFMAQQMSTLCMDVCQGQVDTWVNQIIAECPSASSNQAAIYGELLLYCHESCGLGNPLGYLLEEELSATPLNPHLQNVQNMLGTGTGCATILGDIAVTVNSVYDIQTGANGQNITVDLDVVHPCFVQILDVINDYLQTGNCTTGQIPVNDIIPCLGTGISIGSNAVNFTFEIPGQCLLRDIYFINSSGTPITICNIAWFGNPIINDNGEIEVTLQQVNSNSLEQVTIAFVGEGNWTTNPGCTTYSTTSNVASPKIDNVTISLQDIYVECIDDQIILSQFWAQNAYDNAMNAEIARLLNEQNCLVNHQESFTATYQTTEHHHTLYYYDQAGNLTQTVPPVGVDMAFYNSAIDASGNWNGQDPQHIERTKYQYNSLGQVTWQYSPDGGENQFRYDWAQRLRISEDARQKVSTNFSYTKYDEIGRISEVGELETNAASFGSVSEQLLNDVNFPANNVGTKRDVTLTEYDIPNNADAAFTQENLRNRVSVTKRLNNGGGEDIVTRYSYDEHGNVTSLHHRILGFNDANDNSYAHQIDYDYDLISGNVKEVAYQAGKEDEFFHRYEYDADNRLTHAYTSEDGVIWEKDARYFYYQHGPMARTELGHDKVQGQDYYYTLQGWIKGVNMTGENTQTYEMGRDGNNVNTNINQNMARDAMAYALNYHDLDYQSIGTVNEGAANWTFGLTNLTGELPQKNFNVNGVTESRYGLFNGNIAMMVTDLKSMDGTTGLQAMVYNYDQLHRIKRAVSFEYASGGWQSNTNSQYDATYSYDANGNLETLKRFRPNNGQKELIDNLKYTYEDEAFLLNQPIKRRNRLIGVEDLSTSANNGVGVQPGQHVIEPNNFNYKYDEIGNLLSDASEEISNIVWNTYGKVERVNFTAASGKNNLRYTYDAQGNRLSKTVITGEVTGTTTFYVRDASGNVMSIYKKDVFFESPTLITTYTQKEVPLYGSSRLGQRNFANKMLFSSTPPDEAYVRTRGRKFFELSNHLGNVLTVISDQKLGITSGGSTADYYEAVVLSAKDYYPFGLEMEGRSSSSDLYRYGFNGKEDDRDWGMQNVQDYGFRLYNPAVSRFLSVDPLFKGFPWYTPYQFAGNKPIWAIDLDGLEEVIIHSAVISKEYEDIELTNLTTGDIMTLVQLTMSEGFRGTNKLKKEHEKHAVQFYQAPGDGSVVTINEQTVSNDADLIIYGFTNAKGGAVIKYPIYSEHYGGAIEITYPEVQKGMKGNVRGTGVRDAAGTFVMKYSGFGKFGRALINHMEGVDPWEGEKGSTGKLLMGGVTDLITMGVTPGGAVGNQLLNMSQEALERASPEQIAEIGIGREGLDIATSSNKVELITNIIQAGLITDEIYDKYFGSNTTQHNQNQNQ